MNESLSITRQYSIETAKHIVKLFFTVRYPHHSGLSTPNGLAMFRQGSLTGLSDAEGMKKIAIFGQYLDLSVNLSRKWYKIQPMRIGNRTQVFEWYHFQWHWATPNPDFKVTPLFDAEYLRNDKIYSYCEISNRDLNTPYTQGCHFEWL